MFTTPSRPCAPWSANRTPKTKVSAEAEKSDQLLPQTAWSKAASRPHTLEVWKVLPTQEGAGALPRAAPTPSPFQRGSPSAGTLKQVAPSGWAQWPWLQVLPPATGPTPALPSFPKLLQPTSPSPSPSPSRLAAPATVLPLARQHLVARFPRSAPSSGLIPLLGRKEEPKDGKGDRNLRLSVFPPAQPARGADGSPSGRCRARAALLGLGNARVFCLLRYPRPRSSAQRLPASTALRRPAPSGLVSPAATLSTEPCPRAQSPPLPHSRVCVPVYTHTHAHAKHTRACTYMNACVLLAQLGRKRGLGTSPW